MKSTILILVPTRSRVENLRRLAESHIKTSTQQSAILAVLDMDQDGLYPSIQGVNYFVAVSESSSDDNSKTKPLTLVEKLNMTSSVMLDGEITYVRRGEPVSVDVVGFVGDDCVFQTQGWEERVLTWHKENEGISYCNDLLQGDTLPNNVFISASIIKKMGHMVPSGMKHYYIDNYWKDLGLRLKSLRYFGDIIIEHRHPSNNKAETDETYKLGEKVGARDREIWDRNREKWLAEDIAAILSTKN